MENRPSNIPPQEQETIFSKEELEQQLAEAKKRLEEMKGRASEFYDVALYGQLVEEISKVGTADAETVRLYLESTGHDYEEALTTLDKEKNFRSLQLKPITVEIRAIEVKLRVLALKDKQKEKDTLAKEALENFNRDKQDLETSLYNALEEIHSKIPQEAHDVGMITEAALKTYVPDLVEKAEMLEHFITRLDAVKTTWQLSTLQQEIDSFKKYS